MDTEFILQSCRFLHSIRMVRYDAFSSLLYDEIWCLSSLYDSDKLRLRVKTAAPLNKRCFEVASHISIRYTRNAPKVLTDFDGFWCWGDFEKFDSDIWILWKVLLRAVTFIFFLNCWQSRPNYMLEPFFAPTSRANRMHGLCWVLWHAQSNYNYKHS